MRAAYLRIRDAALSTKTSADGQFLDYRIEEPLGQGGMGVVYAAHDLRLKRKVALKLMAPELALDEHFRERFSREARLAMSLEHPNVVPIHDAGEANGRLYLVMRCVDGTDLRVLLREEGALEPVRALAIVAQVAQALDAAHANGLVHRDVKPSNVLLDENDHVYLADFGLTRRQSVDAAALGDMRSLGTPSYLAPEQIAGGPIDGRADVYSLGCLLFESLTGEPPFADASHLGVAWAHLEEEPPSASERNPELPDALDGVIRKAMAKDREQRYSTCIEFVEDAAAALGRLRHKRSRRRLAVLSAVVGVALVVAAVVVTRIAATGPDYLTSVAPNSVGAIDAGAVRIVAQVPLGPRPGAIASGGGYLWVADAAEGTVSRIDRDLALVRRIDVGDSVDGLAYGRRSIWATDANAGQLVQIDAETARIVQRFRVGNGPAAVAAGDDAVWVANRIDGTLSRLDLANAKVAKPIAIGSAPAAIALGGGAVWVTVEDAGTVLRVDPVSGKSVRSIRVGNGPTAIAYAGGTVWVANRQDGTVSRIASATGALSAPVRVGLDPSGIAADRESVWVANSGEGTITRIAARTGERETMTLKSSPTALALNDARLWVSTSPGLATHRGGVLRLLTEPSLCRCVDPAFGTDEIFNLTDQNVTTLVYDGLLAYRRVGGIAGASLVPNLAARMPVRSADRKRYTFELRRVRFSNGALVRPSDFRSSLERMLVLNGGMERRAYGRIVGASACGNKRCVLSRGILVDDSAGTVTIRLTEPDADLLHKLALPLASVIPARTPRRVARERAPPGTGPYRIATAARDEIRLVRNPHFRVWSSDARPDGYPGEIRFRAQGKESAIRAVESGTADWVELVGIPAGRVRGLLAANAGRLHINPQPYTFWFDLNTSVPPFDDVRVRRALNYATDRGRLARLPAPLSARPACQILPPSFPGYRPFCPYTVAPNAAGTWVAPDMAKARGLVRASGTAGTKIEVLGVRGQIPLALARYFASVLRDLGYRTSLRVFPDFGSYLEYALDASNRAQIGQAGITAPILAPSAFFEAFACSTDSLTQSEFCDPNLDARMRRAAALQASNSVQANRLWSEIDRELVLRAPVVPVANVRQRVFVSRRVGNHQSHPLWGTLIDQLWVE
jgi:ABC-type transport system substrate-binding protein/DNA-binding beta-propeller fold protein YncE/tRNA A-37 threonylcarbamoyl transferase component Bud32